MQVPQMPDRQPKLGARPMDSANSSSLPGRATILPRHRNGRSAPQPQQRAPASAGPAVPRTSGSNELVEVTRS